MKNTNQFLDFSSNLKLTILICVISLQMIKQSSNPYSRVYDSFELDRKNGAYKCKEIQKNGKMCDTIITQGKWNLCSNLKRHLERHHEQV